VFFVEARYHHSPSKAQQQIRYISHREEGLPGGERRELFGIGDRYRKLRGHEPAIRRAFAEDARGLKNPVYFRFILTVDEKTAERFARLDATRTERVIRDAVQNTFRGAARDVQGVFAIHQHGGVDRASHPHVHALLSPRLQNGAPTHIPPRCIQAVRFRWESEVLRALDRQERRLPGVEHQHEPPVPFRSPMPQRGVPARKSRAARPQRRTSWFSLEFLRGRPTGWLGFLTGRGRQRPLGVVDRMNELGRDPERVARRAAFRLATGLFPQPMRQAMWLARGLSGFGQRIR
jgi:hypothetical protein